MMKPNPRLEFFYFDAGGGHRSAATALKEILSQKYPLWEVELVNLQDLLDPIDPLLKFTPINSQTIYNDYMKSGLTFGSGQLLHAVQAGIRVMGGAIENRLAERWSHAKPDLVVSLIPNFNQRMFRALRRVYPSVPYVTIMTDLADCPPHFWLEPQDQFAICGTSLAARQARSTLLDPSKVFEVSGMILKPHFYAERAQDKGAARAQLGLDPNKTTALIMFGGYASKAALTIVRDLQASSLPVQSIVLCGHNTELKQRLDESPCVHAVGFTKDVPSYMELADVFIGKPGPGSISEAIHMGLPVMLERNARTLLQEKYNTRWIEENGLGLVIRDFNSCGDSLARLVATDKLATYARNARSRHNRALFEIPDILFEILRLEPRSPIAAAHVRPKLQKFIARFKKELVHGA